MRTRIRKIATGLPLMLLLAACGQFRSEAEASTPASAAAIQPADDRDTQTEGMTPDDAAQPVWGRLADTDPGLGEVHEVFGVSWDMNAQKDLRQLLARIEADGSFRVLDPDASPMTADAGSSVSDHFSCWTGGLDLEGGDVPLRVSQIEARRARDGRKYELTATNSQAHADWFGGSSQEPVFRQGDTQINALVYQSSGDAHVRGTCVDGTESGGEAVTHYDVRLRSGLNLVSERHDRWSTDGNSERTLQSVQAFPEDMRWYLREPHAPFDGTDTFWGQLDGDGLEATALRIHANEPLDGDQLGPDVPVGETGPDGYFHFSDPALPQAMLDAAWPVGELFCENAEIDNPDARMIQFNLGATDADGGRWILSGAARREHASLRAGHGGSFEQGDEELRVYYLSERVQIEDDCGGNRSSFHFSPGWNLVRATVMEVDGHDDENGPWPTRWSQENLPEVPGDMRWYLFPAFPRMDGQGPH